MIELLEDMIMKHPWLGGCFLVAILAIPFTIIMILCSTTIGRLVESLLYLQLFLFVAPIWFIVLVIKEKKAREEENS